MNRNLLKKLLKIIIPAVLIAGLVFLLQGGKKILDGLYIYFPVIYILNSLISETKKELIAGLLVMSVAFLIPVNICYNMGKCLDLAVIYIILGSAVFFAKKKIRNKKTKI